MTTQDKLRAALSLCIAALEREHHATNADRLKAADVARAALAETAIQAERVGTQELILEKHMSDFDIDALQALRRQNQNLRNVLAEAGITILETPQGISWERATSPEVERKPLSKEQIAQCLNDTAMVVMPREGDYVSLSPRGVFAFAHAIEAAHGIATPTSGDTPK